MSKWLDIKGYEGLYKINELGQVYSLHSNKILKNYKSSDGYLRVNLSKRSKVKIIMVHRLVAEHFLLNEYNLPVVNHIDGNKENPNINNLEWVSFSDNSKHAHRTGLSNISKKNRETVSKIAAENGRKTTSKKVFQKTTDGSIINVFDSIREAERQTDISRTNISLVCHGKRQKAGGYYWEFEGGRLYG